MREEIDCARRLLTIGAYRGAANVLFHAAVQREAKDRADLKAWSPNGSAPLKPRPANSNEPDLPPSMPPVSPRRA